MSLLIFALMLGFLLGILLMIFLVTGREEENLLERVEKAELSREASRRESQTVEESGEGKREERISADEA